MVARVEGRESPEVELVMGVGLSFLGGFRLGFLRGLGRAAAQTDRREERDKAAVAIVECASNW